MGTKIALWLKVKRRAIKLLTRSTLLKNGNCGERFGETTFQHSATIKKFEHYLVLGGNFERSSG